MLLASSALVILHYQITLFLGLASGNTNWGVEPLQSFSLLSHPLVSENTQKISNVNEYHELD